MTFKQLKQHRSKKRETKKGGRGVWNKEEGLRAFELMGVQEDSIRIGGSSLKGTGYERESPPVTSTPAIGRV